MNNTAATKQRWLRRFAAAVFWLLVWQLLAMLAGHRILLASPLDTLKCLLGMLPSGPFWSAAAYTLGHILLGFTLGTAAGILMAAAAAASGIVRSLTAPLLTSVRSVPVASFVIVALIWIPSRRLSILISFLIVLPVVYSATALGIDRQDPLLTEMARVFGMSRLQRLRCIALPSVLQQLASALPMSVGMAWKAGVAAEVIGIPQGSVGERLYKAKIYLATPEMFAWTFAIVVMSMACERLLRRGLRALTKRMGGA